MTVKIVSNTAELNGAIKSAVGGDSIVLRPGQYDGAKFTNLNFDSAVTIQSQDAQNPAILGNFEVIGSSGLQFKNLEFAASGPSYVTFQVVNSHDIGFQGIDFHGSMDGNPQNDGQGLGIVGSQNIRVEGSQFQQFQRAIGVSKSQNVEISGNNLHDLRTAGVVSAEVTNIHIAGNTFSNFFPVAGDHPDAIQFLTAGTAVASRNIVIEGNIIMRGDGEATQGIFLRDQVGTLPYESVKILNNLVVGTGYGGIYVIGAKGIEVNGNELISNPGKENGTWMLIDNVQGGVVSNNEAIMIGYSNVLGVDQFGNTLTAVVLDGGKAAIEAVMSAREELVPSGGAGEAVVDVDDAITAPETPSIVHGVVITGDAANNLLQGSAGDDTIIDGGGADTMIGGAGNDTYYVNNPGKTQYDVVRELPGGGIDTVITSGSDTLSANVENLVLTGKGGTTGYGNELDNIITGNQGDNILNAGAGDDTVSGGLGNDTIVGGAGQDVLIGGAGNDVFWFQKGDGRDVILDFGQNGDRDMLDLSYQYKFGAKPTLTDVGENLVISFQNGDEITLVGVHAHELVATSKGFVMG